MKSVLPETRKRVEQSTSDNVSQKIEQELERNIHYYSDKGYNTLTRRLNQLDKEWDTERVLEANASFLVVVGSILALTVNKKWIFLPAVIGAFLLQHAVQGWCPPLPLIRRFGIRTPQEIQKERNALKEFRGDFK